MTPAEQAVIDAARAFMKAVTWKLPTAERDWINLANAVNALGAFAPDEVNEAET